MLNKSLTDLDYVYVAEFEYDEGSIKRELNFDKSIDEKAVYKKLEANIMRFKKPKWCNLKELCATKKVNILDKNIFEKNDFWLLKTEIDFMPAPDSYLSWLRIIAKIEAVPNEIFDPIFYDAYPKGVYEEKSENQKRGIGLDLNFSEILDARVEYIEEVECSRLEPVISVIGLGESELFWDFHGGASINFVGSHSLYSIIKLPLESKSIEISYFSKAMIKTKRGTFPMGLNKKIKGKEAYIIDFNELS
jgi:hypothetical protein